MIQKKIILQTLILMASHCPQKKKKKNQRRSNFSAISNPCSFPCRKSNEVKITKEAKIYKVQLKKAYSTL